MNTTKSKTLKNQWFLVPQELRVLAVLSLHFSGGSKEK